MLFSSLVQAYSSASIPPDLSRNPSNKPLDDKPPRKPDWLLIMVSILFGLALLIAWLVGVPVLGR